MIISIHQPNFIPWYPFFQKIQKSDIFVILENCQFEKNNFQNRFNINNDWYTMSVNKGLTLINTKKYINPYKDWERIKVKLKEYNSILKEFDNCISDDLSDTNKKIIFKICDILNIKTSIITDYSTDLKSNERLIDICKKHNATHYISGLGGKKYLDIEKFESEKIKLIFQDESFLEKKPIIIKLSEL